MRQTSVLYVIICLSHAQPSLILVWWQPAKGPRSKLLTGRSLLVILHGVHGLRRSPRSISLLSRLSILFLQDRQTAIIGVARLHCSKPMPAAPIFSIFTRAI